MMETKVNSATLQSILSNLNFPYHIYVPPIGLAGGFCVAWRDNSDMKPITTNKHLISLLVFSASGAPWLISVVYGPCSYSCKRYFWESLSTEANRFPGAWLLNGDYNGICNNNDYSSNREIDRGSRSMRKALDNLGMISIPSFGFYYTWSNQRHGRSRVNSYIDRGMANKEWWGLFPNASIKLLPQTTSNHNPYVLHCLGQHSFVKRPFHFETGWVEDHRKFWVVNHAW
ncbi:hypothetical protein UlMin_015026 [Ulmus minor]